MIDSLLSLLKNNHFMPHGHCYLWKPEILWLHVVSDILIGLSYFSIPFAIIVLLRKKQELAFSRIFFLFAIFILACGTTHFMSVYTIWNPIYFQEGLLKIFTAIVSVFTAIVIWPLIPQVVKIPSPNDLKIANQKLKEVADTLEEQVAQKVGDTKRLVSMIKSSADSVVGIDIEGNINFWNDAGMRIFNYSDSEIMGENFSILFNEKDLDRLKLALLEIKNNNVSKYSNMTLRRKDGNSVPCSIIFSPLEDSNSEVIGGSVIIRDLSEEVDLQKQINENQQLLNTLTDSAPNGIILVDEKGVITLCNKQIEKLFGYTKDELTGQLVEVLVPKNTKLAHPNMRNNYIKNPTERQMGAGRDLTGIRKDGTEVPIEIGLAPIKTSSGMSVMASVIDITERKAAQGDLETSNLELGRRNEEMEQFIYTVSHDLKSPLVTSQSFLGFLQDDIQSGDKEAIDDSIRRLSSANKRMTDLINDLLQLSRVGHKKFNLSESNVNELLLKLYEGWESLLEEEDKLILPKKLPKVLCDELKLSQAFDNLVRNAIRYGKVLGKNLEVKINYSSNSSHHIFSVVDNGPGVDSKYHDLIFGLFQRLSTDGEGTGVGLAIVKRVSLIHKGEVWIKSKLGSGAEFYFSIAKNLDQEESANERNT